MYGNEKNTGNYATGVVIDNWLTTLDDFLSVLSWSYVCEEAKSIKLLQQTIDESNIKPKLLSAPTK